MKKKEASRYLLVTSVKLITLNLVTLKLIFQGAAS